MPDDKDTRTLEEFGVYQLTEEIDDGSCSDAIRFILEANLNAEHDHLTLIVNSGGGFITSGFALIDVMEGSSIPIHTVGLGIIASMALNIFICGAKGHRILTPNTMIMSHQWSGGTWGKEHELLAQQKQNLLVTNQMVKHFARHTKLSEKQVKTILMPPSDVFLTPTEAKKHGICDVVKEFRCLTGPNKNSKK